MNEIEIEDQVVKYKSNTIDSESSTINSVDSSLSPPSTESSSQSDSTSENDSDSSSDNEDHVILPVADEVIMVDIPTNTKNQQPSIPNNEVMIHDLENGEDYCVICLESENTLQNLCSCGTTYHETCWNEWQKKDRSCPSCRKIQVPVISDLFGRSFIDYGHTPHRPRNAVPRGTLILIREQQREQELEKCCYYLKLILLFCLLIFIFCYFFLIL